MFSQAHSLDIYFFRLINSEWISPFLDRFMALMSDFNFWKIPLAIIVILLAFFGRFKERAFLILVVFTLIIGDAVISNGAKHLINRPRPWQTLENVRYVDINGVSTRNALPWKNGNSTPSSHTTNTVAVALLVTLFYGRIGILFWILAGIVGYSRIYTGSHFPTDVLISIPLSILYTSIFYYTARRLWKKFMGSAPWDRVGSDPFPYFKISYPQLTLLFIAALAIFRLWFCTQFELVGDEAYYWLWSKHLDWSYFSKGPGVAWTIFLGTKIFGDTVIGIRWISVLLSAGTAWLMFKLARDLFNEQVGFWSAVIAAFVPLFMLGGLVMTIDPLSVFFWALAAWLFWKNKDNPSPFAWVTTGLAIGIGMLCKYTNVAELVCFALFCLWIPQYRYRWKQFFVMTFVALLCLIPVLIWNAQHHWITFHHLIHRGSLDKHWEFSKGELFEFLFSQFLVFNPLFFFGLFLGFLNLSLRQIKNESYRYFICLFIPLIIFYTILSFNKASQANWTAPSWFAGVILLVAFWQEFLQPEKYFYRLAKITVKFALIVCMISLIALHALPFIYFPDIFPNMKSDPLKRIRGAKNISEQVFEIQKQYDASFIIAGNYGYASLLAFYMPNHPKTFVPIHQGFQNQFSFWPDYRTEVAKSAIYVSDSPEILESLKNEFSSVELVKETFSLFRGKSVDKFYLFYCREFKN